MLKQIGYSLVDSSNTEIEFWGNNSDSMVSLPSRVILPDGMIIEGIPPNRNLFNGYRIVDRWVELNPTTEIDNKTSETIEYRDDKIVVVYSYSLPDLETFKSYVKNKLAYKRWQVETGGVIINQNTYSSDRESQTKYTAVAVAISQSDPATWSINWKTNDGQFVVLNAQTMMAVINYVMYHVQNSYNTESEFQTLIDACSTIQEVMAIDIDTGWPSNEFTIT